jgi:crotonobetainyl-CoA:carnitine CoA-transferase CaiB-like acyl-CoA transferase
MRADALTLGEMTGRENVPGGVAGPADGANGSMAREAAAAQRVLPVVVVETGASPAAGFAASLLGDFGAEAIVLEPPGGSLLRRVGGEHVRAVWWPILARNKRSLALDLDHPAAHPVIAALLRRADAVFLDESAAGRTLRRLAAEVDNKAQLMRLFAPGEDRPDLWRDGKSAAFAGCATGAVALTGMPDGPPFEAEVPLADGTSGILAAALTMIELRQARLAGTAPRAIDLGLHEALQRMNEWQLVVAGIQGHAEPRNGNRFPMNSNIGNIFRTRDGKLLTVSAATPSVADRLLGMIGGESLRDDPRFRTPADRRLNMDALDELVAAWMSRHDAAEAMRLVREHDVVVGPIYDASDLLEDPHVAARGDIIRVPDGNGGSIPMPAPLPKISTLPGQVRSIGPAPGEGSRAVLAGLGFGDRQIDELRKAGALWALD